MSNLHHSPYASCARELLALLSDADMDALVKTATVGRIQPVDRREGTTAVLLSSTNVARLLSYRKLTSALLLRYLHTNDLAPDRNGHVSRVQLAMMVSDYWDKRIKKKKNKEAHQNNAHSEQDDVKPNITIKQEPTEEQLRIRKEKRIKQETIDVKTELNRKEEALFNIDNPQRYHNSPLHLNKSDAPITTIHTNVHQMVSTYINAQPSTSYESVSLPSSTSRSVIRVMSDEFSIDFCEWFYTMLNKLQPECAQQSGDTLRPEIFCANCKVEMYLIDGDRMEEKSAQDNITCEFIIRQLLTQLKLLFTPNIDGGIQANKSSHGMIQLFCCGTLHSGTSFLGIFEQEFGLVMCPRDRAWKIIYTKINLKKILDAQSPSLPNSEVFAIEF